MVEIEFPSLELEKQFTDKVVKASTNYLLSVAGAQDIELLVLRAHLWYEKALENMIGELVPKPEKILKSNFSFHHKLSIVYALTGDKKSNSKVYDKLEIVNKIRNEMAHRIEKDKVKSLFKKIKLEYELDEYGKPTKSTSEAIMLEMSSIYGALIAIQEMIHLDNKGIKLKVISK